MLRKHGEYILLCSHYTKDKDHDRCQSKMTQQVGWEIWYKKWTYIFPRHCGLKSLI